MLGRARTVAVLGLVPVEVAVEAHVGSGLPSFQVIGSSGLAARQAADRVKTAIQATGVSIPQRRILVSLAPAELPKAGARFDLAMAVAVLVALGLVPAESPADTALLGELALDGRVRAVPGVLPSAAALPAFGVRRLVVADAAAAEAALIEGLEVVAARDLAEVVGVLTGQRPARPPEDPPAAPVGDVLPDLADVRGQSLAREALEIAAAGGHHLLLVGPPGCGKSMLARRLPSLLPPLTEAQALELAAVRSVAGRTRRDGPVLDRRPPFVAPHHTASVAAVLGGGSGIARPGALSMATGGVLFCDELFEWPRRLLDALREPLEEGEVRVARAAATVTYPARALLVAAANPCPCGGLACVCPEDAVWSYRSRLSGPLADRIDLAPTVAPLAADDLLRSEPGEPSAVVAARVAGARAEAGARWGAGVRTADVRGRRLRDGVDRAAVATLARAVEVGALTGRGFDRTLRVARTIADLHGDDIVGVEHVHHARMHRVALAGLHAASEAGLVEVGA